MSSSNKKLLLSAVSSEFESYRRLLADDLKRPTLDVAVQEDFGVSGGLTLQKLDKYIRGCHGVVHLIGKATGDAPKPLAVKALLDQYPDFATKLPALAERLRLADPGFSYTQWEAYLGIYHDRPVFIYRPADFQDAGHSCPREERFVPDAAEEQSQRDHYRRICDLGRDRGQFLNAERLSSAVLRDLVEILPRLEDRIVVPPTRLRHTAERLIGREQELTILDQAWNDSHKNVVVVRGKGGEGKTSLVASWMAELALKDWRGAECVYDWSFYSQGTREQTTASAEAFIVKALADFGDPEPNQGGPEERGSRLAQLVGSQRCLLVLDGLEPLQYPPGPMHGQLADKGMAALLRGLVGRNAGLCVVTTREKVDEIKQHYGKSAIDHSLEFLSPVAGAALLHDAGARRAGAKTIAADDQELQQASSEVHGHALTLFLVGQYLKLTEDGDIRRRDHMKLSEADAEYKNDATRPYGHAFKAIEAYQTWFQKGDDQARRQLAMLRLLGLFDRPATQGCLAALQAKPQIAGLNDSLASSSDKDWKIALGRLQEINLVGVREDQSVDCHPLIREYFAAQLKEKNPAAWREGHRRLYEHLCATTEDKAQPSLEDLQPLYQAVSHGCQAGLQQEACDKVFVTRIRRGQEDYTYRKLGAFGSDLGAVACFFETRWSRVSATITVSDQVWMLAVASFTLRALGRLNEALEPMRVGVENCVKQEDWEAAAITTCNLSELEVTLGEVAGAVGDAEQSVIYADRSGDAGWKMVSRCKIADAMHQAGHRAEAEARFREAEALEAERLPDYPLLYSLRGFLYCDLLLTEAERAAWEKILVISRRALAHGSHGPRPQEPDASAYRLIDDEPHLVACRAVEQRAAKTLDWSVNLFNHGLLTFALDHLTLGRAAFYAAILQGSEISNAKSEIEQAVSGLRRAGQQQYLPLGLLTRAWLRFAAGQRTGAESAQSDLDEAWEIAERGAMKLFLADIHLYRARLFGRQESGGRDQESGIGDLKYPWGSPGADLAASERLINQCGYHRRDEELADAKTALMKGTPQ